MNTLKKPAVAWSIVIVVIIIAVAIGLFKGRTADPAPAPGTGGNNPTVTTYIHDDAGVLSSSTENKLADITAGTINDYGTAIAVVTCNYGRDDLGDYAMDYAEDIGLGENDFIVVLDISGENYWLVQGYGLVPYFTDQDCSDYAYDYMERDFARGDYDGAVLSLARALSDWYADNF